MGQYISEADQGFFEKICCKEMLEQLPGNFYILDISGRVIFCNQNLLNVQGLDSVDDLNAILNDGKISKEIVDEKVLENNQNILSSQQSKSFVEEAMIAGKRHFFHSHKAPLRHKETGEVIGVYGYSYDVTNRQEDLLSLKQAAQQLDILVDSQARFIAGLCHDLRTPLSGLMGVLEVMMAKSTDPLVHDYGTCAKRAIYGLTSYFERIVQAEKVMRANSVEDASTTVDLEALIRSICVQSMPAVNMEDWSCVLQLNIPHDVSTVVSSFSTILKELLTNALEHAPIGKVEVSCHVRQWRSRSMLSLKVRDSGPGLPLSLKQKIFEPFFQVAKQKMERYGAGLGLAIAKKLAKNMGGDLLLLSSDQEGTVFECLLPYHPCEGENCFGKMPVHQEDITIIGKQKKERFELDRYHGSGVSLALVEDSDVVAKATIGLLEYYFPRLDIRHFGDAESFIQACEEGFSPELIFLDIGLPNMGGDALARKIHKEGLAPHRKALIAVTGHGHELSDSLMDCYFDEIWVKPLSKNKFIKLIENSFSEDVLQRLRRRDVQLIESEHDQSCISVDLLKAIHQAYLQKDQTLVTLLKQLEQMLLNGPFPSFLGITSLLIRCLSQNIDACLVYKHFHQVALGFIGQAKDEAVI